MTTLMFLLSFFQLFSGSLLNLTAVISRVSVRTDGLVRTEGRGSGARRMLEWTGVGLNASLAQQSLEAATTTVCCWLVVSCRAEAQLSFVRSSQE